MTAGTETKNIELVPQKHGGMLRRGNPGHWGGGRPRSVIRQRLSGVMDEHGIGVLEEILTASREMTVTCDGCGQEQKVKPPSSDADRLRAVDVAGRYSIGTITQIDAEQVRAKLQLTIDTIDDLLTHDDAERLKAALQEVW